jgi:hypothetical protein
MQRNVTTAAYMIGEPLTPPTKLNRQSCHRDDRTSSQGTAGEDYATKDDIDADQYSRSGSLARLKILILSLHSQITSRCSRRAPADIIPVITPSPYSCPSCFSSSSLASSPPRLLDRRHTYHMALVQVQAPASSPSQCHLPTESSPSAA